MEQLGCSQGKQVQITWCGMSQTVCSMSIVLSMYDGMCGMS
jgi:hypothetical protein